MAKQAKDAGKGHEGSALLVRDPSGPTEDTGLRRATGALSEDTGLRRATGARP